VSATFSAFPSSTEPTSELTPHVLREYALLADGQRGALIGPRGDVAWLCAPSWHSEAVFSALVGGRGGYAVSPVGRYVWGGYYEDTSLIWRSRWITETGIVECRDALAFPGEPGRVVLLRRIVAVQGDARVEVSLEPAAGFGRDPMRELARDEHGCWRARTGGLWLRWRGAPNAAAHRGKHPDRSLRAVLDVPDGGHHDLVLELSDTPLASPAVEAQRLWDATEASWAREVPTLDSSIATCDARHAYAVLRGLTSSGGGMVAAATMGLPERAEQGRNYDYRYVWIRDQCYAGQAVAVDGAHPLLDDAVRFVTERLLDDGPNLKPAYTITGGPVPGERPLRLPGYPGGRDIVGNHANAQFQLDAFGEALLLLATAARRDHLDTEGHKAITTAVAAITQCRNQPDAGIWELDNQHWAHSRLTCAAGLRAVATAGAAAADATSYSALADTLVADTARDCLHPTGRWQRAPADPRVDAALLLPAIRGATSPVDPRALATLAAVSTELEQEHYVYRFRHDARPLGVAEGAFTLCGFVKAMAAHQQGDTVGAVRYFERNRAACGPPGLFSEEYDVRQRQLRGNLPQAFVHALLLESSLRLATPWPECAGQP
jgi:hypothetical protein